MERLWTILLAVGLVTMMVPVSSASQARGEVLERVEDEDGRTLWETRTVPGEAGLRVTEVFTYAEPGAEPADHGDGTRYPTPFDPGTDCSSEAHQTWGFRWAQPYTAFTNAHPDLLREAGLTWNLATAGTPFGTVVEGQPGEADTFDGYDQIVFDDFHSSNWLARAHIWWMAMETPDGGQAMVAVESDQVYDTADPLTTDPDGGGYDLLSVATHEMGHTLGLQHAFQGCLTMYPYISWSDTSGRTLGDGDILGIQGLYGPVPTVDEPG